MELVLIFLLNYEIQKCPVHTSTKKEISDIGIVPTFGFRAYYSAMKDFVERITIIDMRFQKDALAFIDKTTDLMLYKYKLVA